MNVPTIVVVVACVLMVVLVANLLWSAWHE
jgi:hypothetical protein